MKRSCLAAFSLVMWIHGQQSPVPPLADRALQEFREGKFVDAQRDFRELVKADPENVFAQFYLGQTLFREEKYAFAAGPFEQARALERRGGVLSPDQRRILTDQLVMAYGASGQIKKSRDLLEEAIKTDAEYPLNYYNLACAFAEDGDKRQVLANLALAFKYKDHLLKGEQMPDPRADSSFQEFVRDNDFLRLMRDLGYK